MDGVDKCVLEAITIDLISHDVALTFSGGHVVCQFSNSGFHEIGWTYRNRSKQIIIGVSSAKVELRTDGYTDE